MFCMLMFIHPQHVSPSVRLIPYWHHILVSGSPRIGIDHPLQAHPALDNSGSFQFAAGVLSASGRRSKKAPEARIAPVRRPQDRGAHGRPSAVQIRQWFLGFPVGPPRYARGVDAYLFGGVGEWFACCEQARLW